MSVYPGDPEVSASATHTVAKDGYEVHALSLGSQSGTHVDAPRHVLAGGGDVTSIPPERLCAFTVILQLANVRPRELVQPDDIRAMLEAVSPGDGVIIETGWDRFDGTAQEYEHPGLSRSAAAMIRDAQVAFVGVDAASVDIHDTADLPAHEVFATAGIPIVENLANVATVTWDRPLVSVGALPWQGTDGASARVFAMELKLGVDE